MSSTHTQVAFSDSLRSALGVANETAVRLKHKNVHTGFQLVGCLRAADEELIALLAAFGLNVDRVEDAAAQLLHVGSDEGIELSQLSYSRAAVRVLDFVLEEARWLGLDPVPLTCLLLALLRQPKDPTARMLRNLGVQLEHARRVVAASK